MRNIRDVWRTAVTTTQGFLVTGYYLIKPSTITTVQYPHECLEPSRKARNRLHNAIDRCIACGLCERACPAGCISVESEMVEKKRKLAAYRLDMTTCLFCGLCTEACPPKSLTMESDAPSVTSEKDAIILSEKVRS